MSEDNNIPTKESNVGGIPVTDVVSAQKELLRQMETPVKEQTSNEEEVTETKEDVSAQAMEDAESVENELEIDDELSVEDLSSDDAAEQVGELKTYVVKVDGKEVEVTEDELVRGYSREADYSQKTQVLSEQRKQAEKSLEEAKELRARFEAQLKATQQEREQYLSQLEDLGSQGSQQLKAFETVDWNKLKEEDPMEYMSQRDAYRDLQESQRLLNEKKQQTLLKKQQEGLTVFEEQKKANYEELLTRLPEWADAEKGPVLKKQIKEYAFDKGFTDNEINMMIDARSIDVLHKAMKYESLLKAKISANKKKAKVAPKVQKPGTPLTSQERNSDKVVQQRKRLKQSGKVDDAAALILNQIKKAK